MNIQELTNKVAHVNDDSSSCLALHRNIVEKYANTDDAEEREILLALHEALMDKMEEFYSKRIGVVNFKKLRLQEYNKLLLRECEIGGSFCVDTMYELTQRELEAGRMLPTHEFIDISIAATATDHYSREQLDRQQDKIQNIKQNSALNKLANLFKSD